MINNEIQTMGRSIFDPFGVVEKGQSSLQTARRLASKAGSAVVNLASDVAAPFTDSSSSSAPGPTGPMDPSTWNKPMDPAAAARAASIAQSVGKAAADASAAADQANRLQQQAQAKAVQASSDLAMLRANPLPPAAKSHALIWIGVAVAGGLGVMLLMGGHTKRRAARRRSATPSLTVIK